jgi:hypothetical protein
MEMACSIQMSNISRGECAVAAFSATVQITQEGTSIDLHFTVGDRHTGMWQWPADREPVVAGAIEADHRTTLG